MSGEYTYHAPDGDLTVSPAATDSLTIEITGEPDVPKVTVLTEHLPDLLTEICRVAGEQAPILLDHPDPKYTERASTGLGVFKVQDGEVVLETCCDHCSGEGARRLPPDVTRAVGAVLVAMADYAAAEPDPAEVAELAKVMRDLVPASPDGAVDDWARALLRRYEVKERTP